MQEIKSTIFERMMYIAYKSGYKNVNELSKALNYKSPEKLYRLERNKNAKPSIDIISDFSNMFDKEDILWVITGKSRKDESDSRTFSSQKKTNNAASSFTFDNINTQTTDSPCLFITKEELKKYPYYCQSPEYIHSLQSINIPDIENGTYRAFKVSNENMFPTIQKNDIAIGFQVKNVNNLVSHNVYIVISKTKGILIGRIICFTLDQDRVFLTNDNINKSKYPNIVLLKNEIIEIWELRRCIISRFPYPHPLHNRLNELDSELTQVNYTKKTKVSKQKRSG